ncbi:hypothetical protein QUF54_04950 [Candidatus Marithioploca araucensis]|uniref:Uncharacterized protein n=1 Tax=Candidatus Marithioploca araucensis TaxID=70273 RepID=A0ABT7VSY2_9GAMM|nr:hypothetical protein [Candidatus Marithioploca araucensis]
MCSCTKVAHPTWLSHRREQEKVHDAIAYAPYELRFINQTYAAYELRVTSYQSDICGLRVRLTPAKFLKWWATKRRCPPYLA